jgi:hypothetical protein
LAERKKGLVIASPFLLAIVGGGVGTYEPTLTSPAALGSIRERVVNAVTGDPLPGDREPFASVTLLRCEAVGCFDVNAQPADTEGRFRFTQDFSGSRSR